MQPVIGQVESTALERFVAQFRAVFPRRRSLHTCVYYPLGVVPALPGRSMERIAEVLPGTTVEQLQQFLVDRPLGCEGVGQATCGADGRGGLDGRAGGAYLPG